MDFNFNNEKPIYIQLVEILRLYIVSNENVLGQRLPSVRELAIQARVNPNTVQKALAELENENLIYTERTNGKFITKDSKLVLEYKNTTASNLTSKYIEDMKCLGINKKTIISYINCEEEKK